MNRYVMWSSCHVQYRGGQPTGGHLSRLVFVANSCGNPQVGNQFERFLLPYTRLGPFRALKVQSKLVHLGGSFVL